MNKSLEQLREEIDRLDDQIIRLLNQRSALAVDIGHIKKQTGTALYVPSREQSVLNRLIPLNKGPLSHRSICRIYREIMASALALEHREYVLAGGAGKADIEHAVHFLAGANIDVEYHEQVDGIVEAIGKRPNSVLIVSERWYAPLVDALHDSSSPPEWRGCWSIVSQESNEIIRYHVLGQTPDHFATSRPAVIYCLMNKDVFYKLNDADWLKDIPASSFEFSPLINQSGQGILKINLQVSIGDLQSGWTEQLSRQSAAVWVV